jgi:uncharacterized repeat protein (TIGR02543 family)
MLFITALKDGAYINVRRKNMNESSKTQRHLMLKHPSHGRGGVKQFIVFTLSALLLSACANPIQEPARYTITFSSEGGSRVEPVTAEEGTAVAGPISPVRKGYTFTGWYSAANGGNRYSWPHTLTGNVTMYAQWRNISQPEDEDPPEDGGSSLAAELAKIKAKAVEGGEYTITVQQNETITPQTLSFDGKTISITLTGGGEERTISPESKDEYLSDWSSLFTIESNATLILDKNITLHGSSNSSGVVQVKSKAALVMEAGSKISGNTKGSGVYVSGGTFTMNGGEITDNTGGYYSNAGVYVDSGAFIMNGGAIKNNTFSDDGSGVYVSSTGTFTMNGGEITGNTSSRGGGGVYNSGTFTMNGGRVAENTASSNGGGVYVSGIGTFTMYNGTISGNTISSSSSYDSGGGGVYNYGTFTMHDGTISGNTNGGGVYNRGTFTMNGGDIAENKTSTSGGGVYVSGGTFTMNSGRVAENTASTSGGGVYINYGTFTMHDGSISSNTASSGGGVYIDDGTFTKSGGGTIYGSDAEAALQNTASVGYGHAVYNSGYKRDTTAGPEIDLGGSSSNWE